MATFDLEVEPETDADEAVALRFKTLGPPRQVHRVRDASGARLGWSSLEGVGEGGAIVPVYAVDIEDSSEGTATLVYGGIHGLRLLSEADGVASREPYLVLAPDAVG